MYLIINNTVTNKMNNSNTYQIHHYLTKCLVTALMMLFVLSNLQAQGWEKIFGDNADDETYDIIVTEDKGYAFTGYTFNTSGFSADIQLIRTDQRGVPYWTTTLGGSSYDQGNSLQQTTDGGFIIGGYSRSFGNILGDQLYLVKTDENGTQEWAKGFGGDQEDRGEEVIQTSDGGYLLIGSTKSYGNGNNDIYIVKTNADGDQEWASTYGGNENDKGHSIVEVIGEGYVFTGSSHNPANNTVDVILTKISYGGDEIWSTFFGENEFDVGFSVLQTADQGFIIAASIGNSSDAYLIKTNDTGVVEWSQGYGGTAIDKAYDVVINHDGGYCFTGITETSSTNVELYLVRTDIDGNVIWEKTFGRDNIDIGNGIAALENGGFIVGGTFDLDPFFTTDANHYLLKTDSLGNIYSNYIQGNVYRDLNFNCLPSIDETGIDNWIIEVSGTQNYYDVTDLNGDYNILVDTGSYEISLFAPNNYWEACQQNFNINLFDFYDTTVIDFPVKPIVACPLLEVDISTPILKSCQNSRYTVRYCNRGTIDAEAVYVDITLPAALTPVTSSTSYTDLSNGLYRFDVADLAVGACEVFTFDAQVACDSTTVGQSFCVEAHIYPDSICTMPSPDWDQSSVNVGANCNGDSIQFKIYNIGLGDMLDSKIYYIVEDDIMYLNGDFDLDSGDSLLVSVPANGSTYRIIAEQSAGHPGNSYPTLAIEGCDENSDLLYSVGYVTQFPEDDGNPFVSIDCQENEEFLNFNDKRGHPKGVYEEHLIDRNTDIEYTLRFQNLEADTAFNVVIRDTISPFLTVTSVIAGASSHEYDFEVEDGGILKFTFSNIKLPMLPDSSATEPNFHGFVKFKIAQKPDLADGTVIRNSAAISFDYQVPIITNETFHTVSEDALIEVITAVNEIDFPSVAIHVYPNPFVETATFEISGETFQKLNFTLFDLTGKLVRRATYASSSFQFQRQDLSPGMYVYRIESDGRWISTGKIIIQ